MVSISLVGEGSSPLHHSAGFCPSCCLVHSLGLVGSALQFAGAAVPALALCPAGAQAAQLIGVLFIPPRNVQASKDLRELTERHVLLRAGGVTAGGGAALRAVVSSQGMLVSRPGPTPEVWLRTMQAVQIEWGKEEGRRAVQIWRPQGGT